MSLATLFLIIFIVGPVLFRQMTKPEPSRASFWILGLCTGLCALGGLAVRFGLPLAWGRDFTVTIAGIALIWIAWISVLSPGAQSLRRRDPGTLMRRWTGMIGAIGTTVPWFGLASASLMQG
ncbi:hypothetical protein C1J03_21665 [Sulfitobacter sp. SK012]|uniref:hypothetical protein n=1 Tax=Sulfitobacter sp. SK012 TaxID=1389005 RepID=UPI000E0B3FD6|nr:hypothetical protein [Sulfitobacter sp. SK012]AXI48370.1 hypothetical protein C1J03_21665 [Sulfitobacter sp. SK012]